MARGRPWKLSRFTVCWCSSSIAALPCWLAGSRIVAAARRIGAWLSRSMRSARTIAAGCAGTTAGVKRSGVTGSGPSHGARTSTPVSWSSAPERSRTDDPERSALRQCLRVRSSPPAKNVKSTRSKASSPIAWTKVISSPTWSSWPSASSPSSSMKLAAANGDSEMASFSSRPSGVDAPAIAILYTEFLLFAVVSAPVWAWDCSLSASIPRYIQIIRRRLRAASGSGSGFKLVPWFARCRCGRGRVSVGGSPAATALPGICRPRPDAGEHVHQRRRKQHHVGEAQHDVDDDGDQRQDLEWMAAGEVDLLARPEPPGAHHEESSQTDKAEPGNGNPMPAIVHGNPVEEVDRRG